MTGFELPVHQTYSTTAPLLSELAASRSWSFPETATAEWDIAPLKLWLQAQVKAQEPQVPLNFQR